jgi:hypothetical protein
VFTGHLMKGSRVPGEIWPTGALNAQSRHCSQNARLLRCKILHVAGLGSRACSLKGENVLVCGEIVCE